MACLQNGRLYSTCTERSGQRLLRFGIQAHREHEIEGEGEERGGVGWEKGGHPAAQ